VLKLADLSRSTFYYRQKMSLLADRHAALKDRIKAIFALHKGRYGYRRVTAAIRQLGKKINHKTVQRLMVERGLKSLVRPKKYRSYKGSVGRVAPDPPGQQRTADPAFRSGMAIPDARLSAPASKTRHRPEHVTQRNCLDNAAMESFFARAQIRVLSPQPLR
jgi:transposase InsO family protein